MGSNRTMTLFTTISSHESLGRPLTRTSNGYGCGEGEGRSRVASMLLGGYDSVGMLDENSGGYSGDAGSHLSHHSQQHFDLSSSEALLLQEQGWQDSAQEMPLQHHLTAALTQALYSGFVSTEDFQLSRFRAIDFLKKELYGSIEPQLRPSQGPPSALSNLEQSERREDMLSEPRESDKQKRDEAIRPEMTYSNPQGCSYFRFPINQNISHIDIKEEPIYSQLFPMVPRTLAMRGLDWNELNVNLWRFVFHHVLKGEAWRKRYLSAAMSSETNPYISKEPPPLPRLQFIQVLSSGEEEGISIFNGFLVEGKKFVHQKNPKDLPLITDFFRSRNTENASREIVPEGLSNCQSNSAQEPTCSSYSPQEASCSSTSPRPTLPSTPPSASADSVRVLLLSSPLKLGQAKSKHHFEIKSTDDYRLWLSIEREYIDRIVNTIKPLNIDILICQWEVAPEIADRLDREFHCQVIQYMTGNLLQQISELSGGKICFQLEDVDTSVVGVLKSIVPIKSKPREEFGVALVVEALESRNSGEDSPTTRSNDSSTSLPYPLSQSLIVHISHPFSGEQIQNLVKTIVYTLHSIMYSDHGVAVHGGGAFEAIAHINISALAESRGHCQKTQRLANALLAPIRQLIALPGRTFLDDNVNSLIDFYSTLAKSNCPKDSEGNEECPMKLSLLETPLIGISPSGDISPTLPLPSPILSFESSTTDSNCEQKLSSPPEAPSCILLESPTLKWHQFTQSFETVCSILKVDQIIEIDDAIET